MNKGIWVFSLSGVGREEKVFLAYSWRFKEI
jgi:hypothetical protein